LMRPLGAACVVAALFFGGCLLLVDADGQFKIPSETCSHLSLLKSEAWTACLRALESVRDLKLHGTLAKSPEANDVLVLKGQLGEGARAPTDTAPPTTYAPTTDAPTETLAPTTDAPTNTPSPTTYSPTTDAPTTAAPSSGPVGSHRRRANGGMIFYSSANGGGESNTVAGLACDCAGPSTYFRRRQLASNCLRDPCYNRGWSGGNVIEFWDKSGMGQNYKIETWWRIAGNYICLKYMAWEGGMYFYNLLDRGSLGDGASEVCIAKSEGSLYSQGDIIDTFVDQCDLLPSKFQSRCKNEWQECMKHGSNRRRAKGYVEEERRSERRLLATDTTSDTTQSGWWSQPSWEVDCVS